MLSVDQALALYRDTLSPTAIETRALDDSLGLVLARDVHSRIDLPPMRQSAMDGYAVRAADISTATNSAPVALPQHKPIAAGQMAAELPIGYCARIFTGAPLPAGADSVEIQENVKVTGGQAVFRRNCQLGSHVRRQGEELAEKQKVLARGLRMDAQGLSLAAAAGHAYLPCHRTVRASVIVTGDELVSVGQTRGAAQIYESNGHFLRYFLSSENARVQSVSHSRDDAAALSAELNAALAGNDLILISGGASVGDHDHSRAAALACGVREVFWKVAQKPGKPLYFGIGPQGQTVFVLPGNPASVHACAYVHVRAALRRMQGASAASQIQGDLLHNIEADSNRERLLRAGVDMSTGRVRFNVLPHQASHMLSNLPDTRAIVRIPPSIHLQAGTRVAAWLIRD